MNEEARPATVSFSRAKAQASPTDSAVVPANTTTAVQAPPAQNYAPCVEGEVDSKDFRKPPVLKYVNGGETAAEHPEWNYKFVWDKAVALGDGPTIIVTKASKFYREIRPYESEDKSPLGTWSTKAEAEASGIDHGPAARLEILIEASPETAAIAPCENWAVSLGTKWYIPAIFYVQSSSYGIFETIMSDLKRLKNRFANGVYKLQSRSATSLKGKPYRKVYIAAAGLTPADVSEAIKAEFNI